MSCVLHCIMNIRDDCNLNVFIELRTAMLVRLMILRGVINLYGE